MTEKHFLGEWQQVSPPTAPEEILITFDVDGQLTWTIEDGRSSYDVALTWRLDGDVLVINEGVPDEQRLPVRFESPTRLHVGSVEDSPIYERC